MSGIRMRAGGPRLVLLAALAATSFVGAADPPRAGGPAPYAASARVAHIQGALTALSQSRPAELQEGIDYARALERGSCAAGAERLRVECLLIATRRYCHDRAPADATRCPLYMDIVVSNVLADEELIPQARRYQIVRENRDYRPALARELRRIQGTLAVDYRLHGGEAEDIPTMAASIDRYCQASADETELSYQTCVSALAWFIEGPR